MDFFQIDPIAPSETTTLERNLEAIARRNPQLAARLRIAAPRTDIEFALSEEGVLSVRFTEGAQLTSRRTPLTEAGNLADTVDIKSNPAVAVLGFGAGYHTQILAERLRESGIVLCFEPDLAMLRAVLEHIDHAQWINTTNFVLLSDPDDAAAISHALTGAEALAVLGAKLVDHPPSRARLGDQSDRFGQRFADVLKATRTTILTTLVQSETTLRNALMNLDHYASNPGIADLAGCCAGSPAVVVAAGPSLERNLDLLSEPGVRDRVVIIAVQTVLRTMLDRGIRPHFVAALDHHEISKRFYEGLTPADVEGITLIVEPKANPAILDAFPGAIRCVGTDILDAVLQSPELPGHQRGELKPGATVAHLCYYFARHLGCDPVMLIGQDLGFSDGQYYSAGAAIHNVWASELSDFRTLEMFEWERIAREKSLLRRKTDVLGRTIYTDEQMATYLAQFEADFLADTRKGLTIIDATQGGVAKQHTQIMPLADALEDLGRWPRLRLPAAHRVDRDADLCERVRRRLVELRTDARTISSKSRETRRLLRKISRPGTTIADINAAVPRIHAIRDDVLKLQPAFMLTQFLNQTGTLNRFRADRSIGLEADLSEFERQQRRIERDIDNVTWIADAADALCALLEDAAIAVVGGHKRTRDAMTEPATSRANARRSRVAAVLAVDFEKSSLAEPRTLEAPIIGGMNALSLTVARLLMARRLKEVICLTDDEPRLRAALGDLAARVIIAPLDLQAMRSRTRSVAAARRFSPASWRGSISTLCCYDEIIEPRSCLGALTTRNIDAAVLVGADWCCVDPQLIDTIISRHHEQPDSLRLVFSQAPPGLGGLLIDRTALASIVDNQHNAGCFATIGAMLSYIPYAPQADPIAKPMCVPVTPAVRDLGYRCIPDATSRLLTLRAALVGHDPLRITSESLASALTALAPTPDLPEHVTLELTPRRTSGGTWSMHLARAFGPLGRTPIDTQHVISLINQLAPATTLTFHGAGDPLEHPDAASIIAHARARGLATHVRTSLLHTDAIELLDIGCDVISVDLLAISREIYAHLTGVDAYEQVKARVEALISARDTRSTASLPIPWIVPRITRSDIVVEHIEGFYDGWIRACGCAVIDPLPVAPAGERIRPLPLPASATWRNRRSSLTIRSDGSILNHTHLNVFEAPLPDLWRAVLDAVHPAEARRAA